MERLTDYTQENGLGLVALGHRCGWRYDDAHQACEEKNAMPARINAIKKQIAELNNGQQMKMLSALENEITNSRVKLRELEGEKKAAIANRDVWRDTPDAALARLGFSIKTGCGYWTDMESSCKSAIIPLKSEFAKLQKELEMKKERIAPKNIAIQQQALSLEKNKIAALTNEISKINQETANIKNAYNARKEAERLALERERQEREAVAAAAAKKAAEDKKKKDLLLIAGAIAAAAGLYYLSGNKQGTQQKMKVKVKL